MKLSVIIPAYNEEQNFKRGVLDKVWDFLSRQKISWEVILVDDGSTDKTLKLLQVFAENKKGFKVLDISHGGKVMAITAGVKEANGEVILFSDFDQSTPITEIKKVMEEFNQGADIVIAKRAGKKEGWSTLQALRSKTFNLMTQLLILPGISDTQCGFKAFKNSIAKDLFNKLVITKKNEEGRYMGAFDVELLYLAKKMGLKIVSIPVSWKYYKSGKFSVLEPLKMLIDLLKLRLQGINKNLLAVLLLLFLTIPAFKDTIATGFFPMHDDLQMMRQLVMDKCFRDGQIPCRWSFDLGYGFGYPLFNFYPPLPYYFGQVIHFLGFAFNDTVKVLVILNFIVSGLLMFLLAKEFWGRWGGVISALFYVYAPYHAVDIYARGAMNEAWAIAWFPAVFWVIYKIITLNKWKYVPLLAIFLAFLMLSHNPMLMIFAPFALLWVIFWLVVNKSFQSILKLAVGGGWALGLSAFFTLPVIFEQKYAHVETLVIGYFNYLAHFATLNQLFISRFWGYGDSRFGPVDDISFQIGHMHWILALFSIVIALILARKKPVISLMILMIFGSTLFYTFMTHQNSSFIWERISQLQFLQFPWRFLSISIFGTSFLAGSIVLLFRLERLKKISNYLIVAIIFGAIIFYGGYFKWKDHWPWVHDSYKFSGELWRLQITSGIFDYLPIWAPLPPPKPPKGDGEIIEGQGNIETKFKNSIRQEYLVKIEQEGTFQLNTFYFPGWKYFVDNREVSIDPKKDLDKELGRPLIKLQKGEYEIVAKLENTPVRTLGNSLSLFSWVILIGLLLWKVRKPRVST